MNQPASILAATDFSDASRVAVGLASRLAHHTGGTLHLVHVEEPLLVAAARHGHIDLAAETRRELEAFAATLVPPPARAEYQVARGDAVTALLETAARLDADVLVVGRHGMSGPAHLVFGSVTEGLVRHAELPLLVVPPSWSPPEPSASDLRGTGPVVAATDFTPAATAGVEAACGWADLLDSDLEVLHVAPEPFVLARWQAHAQAAAVERLESVRRELETLASRLPRAHRVRAIVESGQVPAQLAASTAPAPGRHPVLVLGKRPRSARGTSPVAVTLRALAAVSVPVLVQPHTA
ncbi:MAG: universal stress protein [Vicinamibacterales bacterium]